MVLMLDDGLRHFANITYAKYGMDINGFAGAAAAGGIGGRMKLFFNADILSGIGFLLEAVNFRQNIQDADLIITGEGKFDNQSLNGKVIEGIVNCNLAGIPIIIITGVNQCTANLAKLAIVRIYETNREHLPFETIKDTVNQSLEQTLDKMVKDLEDADFWKSIKK